MKLPIDNVLSNLEATFLALKTSGNESWKNPISCKSVVFGIGVKTNSDMIPPVCLAGAFFFDFWHVPFQKNTYIAVFGTKISPNHTNPLQAPSPFQGG